MPLITVPAADSQLDVVTFGAPVANAINDLNDRVTVLESTDWAPYSPAGGINVLRASTTNPTQGSTGYLAEYFVNNNNLIQVRMQFTIDTGGGFSAGSGNWRFMLPPAYPTMTLNSARTLTGAVFINDSGTALRTGVVYGDSNQTYVTVFYDNGSALATLGSGGPGTAWQTGDAMAFSFFYEPA